ncbi:MAG TPA: TetR family transcriptional regulator [Aggregatilineaceae bacterium]|nr:TetR family transcriptional regulator [Aggregatilineaceae bacterium]
MRRTKEEAAVTRQTILEAALHIFGSKGYSATRLEDIAEAAGVTRGAVYWHFQNKAQLYNTLVIDMSSRVFEEVIGQAMSEGGSYLDMFKRIHTRVLDMVERYPEMRAIMELVSHKVEEGIPELAETFQTKVEIVQDAVRQGAEFLEQGINEGILRSDLDAFDMAWAWQAFREGVTQLWLQNPSGFSLIQKAPTLVDIYLRGIVKSDPK